MKEVSTHRSLAILFVIAALCLGSAQGWAQDAARAKKPSGELAPMQAAPAQPARVKKLKLAPGDPRFECQDGECVCKGVLDCKSLLDSGSCKGKEFWQDGKDPSAGGCG